jgi:hypothetical protein
MGSLTLVVSLLRVGMYYLPKWQVPGVPIDIWVRWASFTFTIIFLTGFFVFLDRITNESKAESDTHTQ